MRMARHRHCRLLLVMACALVVAAGGLRSAVANPLDEVTFYTETFAPFNFKQDGRLTGIGVDVVEAVLERAGSSQRRVDFELVTWHHGFGVAKRRADTALFSMARTEDREKHFTFIGPFAPARLVVMVPNDLADPPNSVAEINADDRRVAVIHDDSTERILREKGVEASRLMATSSPDAAVDLLRKGRVHGWAYSQGAARHVFERHDLADAYEVGFILAAKLAYMAFNRDTDPAAIKAFREAFNALKNEGRIVEIRNRYLGCAPATAKKCQRDVQQE